MSDAHEVWVFPNGQEVTVNSRFYPASCDACGWQGSSEDCGTDWGGGDDSDVYCPHCRRSGCDSGRAGDAAVKKDPRP